MSTTAIFGSYVLSRKDGAQDVLRDHWVLVEGKTIAAITRSPADALGMSARYGTLTKGMTANLVVWSGDPLELSTRVRACSSVSSCPTARCQ